MTEEEEKKLSNPHYVYHTYRIGAGKSSKHLDMMAQQQNCILSFAPPKDLRRRRKNDVDITLT